MEDAKNNRDVIRKTALRLFSRLGFAQTSVITIAGEAGITKPTLYYYYGSKNALLEAIVAEYGIPLLNLTAKAAVYEHDLVMNLSALFRDLVDYAAGHPEYFRLLVSLYSSAPETPGYDAGNGIRKRLVAKIEDLFERAAADHGNMRNRQKMYAETFFGLIQTWALLIINREVSLTDENRNRLVHQYMHGIFS
ncbi:MAG: TetR/AcrR family transcriptional regulator [Spirochaetaceae bacterium]|jgi:TetR/AcrR family transcriptional regulator|nr:TetR/AcrR family transcriptional regulator [Spirochaetaceae bacterium]